MLQVCELQIFKFLEYLRYLLCQEISLCTNLQKAQNTRVVIFGKAQPEEDGIIQCTITMFNFSMWDTTLLLSYKTTMITYLHHNFESHSSGLSHMEAR